MTHARSAASSARERQGQARAATRYYDRQFQRDAVKILPGEYYTTGEDLVLVTVLGSCVSACLVDPTVGVGGMNHFMLPNTQADGVTGVSARYGSYAMELLVNDLLKLGARRERLAAKVFGGGQVLQHFSGNPAGARNASFVLDYLATECIAVVAQDLGHHHARKLCFFPRSGQAFVRRIDGCGETADLLSGMRSERAYGRRLRTRPITGDIELFE